MTESEKLSPTPIKGALVLKEGEIVYFKSARKTLSRNGIDVGFKDGHYGFGIMLGISPKNAPPPPGVFIISMLNRIGFPSYDQVLGFLKEEGTPELVDRFMKQFNLVVKESEAQSVHSIPKEANK